MSGQWQLEGSAAEIYERTAARYILGPWAQGLVDLAGIGAGEHVLDLACGTGAVARVAAERVGSAGSVTGLDLNAGMIAVARSLPPPRGATIAWVERSAQDTGLPDASFDAVLCQQGLQFFPDKPEALREARRVLVPGGRIAMSVWRTTGVYNAAVGRALARHVGSDASARFCASRKVPEDRELIGFAAAAGLREAELHLRERTVRLPSVERFVLSHLAGTPVAAELRAAGDTARAALAREVAQELFAYRAGDGVAFPEEITVITARA
jgi:SAM-dependent methyltransferase